MRKRNSLGLLFAAAVGGFCTGCSPSADSDDGLAIAEFDYPSVRRRSCKGGQRSGAKGATDGLVSKGGVAFSVRAPANYDATFAHALLVVYAPAGMDADANEAFTSLTSAATKQGFIVAYTAHRRMSLAAVHVLAAIPGEIAATWCIDPGRVFAAGHSDGGTVATAVALLDETRGTLAAIAPSAAGFSRKDLEAFKCPASPLPVMVMHGKRDLLFPGWGEEAAKWWAACNGCDLTKPRLPGADCSEYQGCARGGRTRYCESANAHAKWPGLSNQIIQFLKSGRQDPLAASHTSLWAGAA